MVTKKTSSNHNRKNVKTTIGLYQTKPAKTSKIIRLQKKLAKPESKKAKEKEPIQKKINQSVHRNKPASQIAKLEKTLFWFLPARLSFLLNGIYILIFSIFGIFIILSNLNLISTVFISPLQPTFTTTILLELVSSFGIMASILMFMSALKPYKFKFFYYFMLVIFLPANFISDFARLQLQIPIVFKSYLYFDIIAVSFFWIVFLLSLPAYLKYPKLIKKIKLNIK